MKWTPEDIVQLRTLWAKEWKTERIGKKMGRSKNSVIGMADRLGLPIHPGYSHKRDARKSAHNQTAKNSNTMAGKMKIAEIEHGQQGEYTFEQIAGEPMCKFPKANNTWCGRAVINSSPYCSECHSLCYRPTPVKRA